MFSALRQGAILYIMEKADKPNIKVGYVESVTQPRPKYPTYNPALSFNSNMETLVDIIVKVDNDKKEIIGVPSNLSIHRYGDYVISESRDAMLQEVDGMMQASKSIVESVDYHKQVIESCERMLKELNPSFAKEQERDDAIDSLKGEVSSLREDMSKILSLLTKANN